MPIPPFNPPGCGVVPSIDTYHQLYGSNSHGWRGVGATKAEAARVLLNKGTPEVGSGYLGNMFRAEAEAGQKGLARSLIGCPAGGLQGEMEVGGSAVVPRGATLPPGNYDNASLLRRDGDKTHVPPMPPLALLTGAAPIAPSLRYTHMVTTRYPLHLGATTIPKQPRRLTPIDSPQISPQRRVIRTPVASP